MTRCSETVLSNLRRPRLLIRAARFALGDYDRARGLARVLGPGAAGGGGATLDHLIACEAELEQDRRSGSAGYCIARHIEVLVALMAEARQALSPDVRA
ncbi:DUF6477 family protein [Oceaniglobus roseus]|uniref:DUF6477 family protein n=1 Tax=Oceaniglobus roseus TaxID=1737570 RepID=UPI000C7EB679|nr:DUF6477 family protein [Kandeliimicrobium roseum]